MAAVQETAVLPRQVSRIHRRVPLLQPLTARVPSSVDRNFEQYVADHQCYYQTRPKLPAIVQQQQQQPLSIRQSFPRPIVDDNELFSFRERQRSLETKTDNNGPISRLLNSDQYRRAHARLIEYRQHSKIPGVTLAPSLVANDSSLVTPMGPLTLPLIETTKAKTSPLQQQDDFDLIDDDSVISNESDSRRRAKLWVKEHQFFFTEYQ